MVYIHCLSLSVRSSLTKKILFIPNLLAKIVSALKGIKSDDLPQSEDIKRTRTVSKSLQAHVKLCATVPKTNSFVSCRWRKRCVPFPLISSLKRVARLYQNALQHPCNSPFTSNLIDCYLNIDYTYLGAVQRIRIWTGCWSTHSWRSSGNNPLQFPDRDPWST